MKTIWVRSAQGKYPVFIGERLLEKTGRLIKPLGAGKVMIVTQKRAARFHLAPVLKSLRREGIKNEMHFLPDGEEAKSGKELSRLYSALVKKGFERRDMVLALGGGVVGDVSGFAASTYLRGVSFVNIATTLLAQVDSSIGGKTGINLKEGKNLVGAFYPARLVICDIRTLATLPAREFQASMAEVVKYGMIRSPGLFQLLERSGRRVLAGDPRLLTAVVTACARIKASVVSRDERETKGERMILNYGHTFAHAFEQALGYEKLTHGEAVSIGMICAAELAILSGLFSREEAQRQKKVLENLHLPVSLSRTRLRVEDILPAMMRDKKKRAGKLRFVLPARIGRVLIKDPIPSGLIRKVILQTGGKA